MSQSRRLSIVLALNLVMLTVLLVTSALTGSLGLAAQAVDFLADSLALVLGLVAVWLRDRRGYQRAPVVVAAVNGAWLLALTVGVVIASIERLVSGAPEIRGVPVLIASGVAAVVMFAGALILGAGAGREDLHMRSVLLDTLADGLTALMVALTGLIIALARGAYWLDPVAAIIVSAVVAVSAVRLLGHVVRALRTGRALELGDGD